MAKPVAPVVPPAVQKTCKITGQEMIAVDLLDPHPLANIPMEDDDQHSIDTAIAELGCVGGVIVTHATHDGRRRHILEGCHRVASARASGQTTVPCVIVDVADPRALIASFLSTGRRKGIGQRILTYLELHQEEVLAAHREANGGKANLKKGQCSSGVSRETPGNSEFTSEAIAERLQCSREDVLRGIELLRCQAENVTLRTAYEPSVKADAAYQELLAHARRKILSGATPIRRWKAALQGKLPPQDSDGKSPTDYQKRAISCIASLRNLFKNWNDLDTDTRGLTEDLLARCMRHAPPEIMASIEKSRAGK